MKFVIQHNLMNQGQLDLTINAVKPYPHEYVGVVPFDRVIESESGLPGKDYIPYGSTLFTNLALERGWTGLYFNKRFTYSDAVRHRKDMLNGQDCEYTIIEAKSVEDYFIGCDPNQFIFTRPSEDLKQYSGQVMTVSELVAMVKSMMDCPGGGSYYMPPNTEIVISIPKTVQAEWRWFIVNRKIVSGAMYKAHGQLRKIRETDSTVIQEAQKLADGWLPHDCVVMDTALIDGKLYVCEFNCINSSGFYDHDVDAIFKAIWEYNVAIS